MRFIFNILIVYFSTFLFNNHAFADNFEKAIQAFNAKEYIHSKSLFLPLAEAGNAEAMFYLGQIYDNGLGVQPNSETAFNWYEKSGKNGHAQAAFLMSLHDASNQKNTFHWAKLSADKGFLPSMMRLADLYWLKQDFKNSLFWYEKAAINGSGSAAYFLGDAYKVGAAGNVQNELAIKWFKQALNLNEYPALEGLFELCSLGNCSKEDSLNVYKWHKILDQRRNYKGRKASIYDNKSETYKRVYEKIEKQLSTKDIEKISSVVNSCVAENYLKC